ncbi:hypothetical protein TGRH88_022830 [Toxoplasma gondii]|uniref:Uncharacterized protein n=1 Tax=Toxoplasma gondii TaxID=5811 RepID=A0A7J6KFT0_TOXGO|nr:hypothetical protein TGRH88_022830 [Toxoplasma gondii]
MHWSCNSTGVDDPLRARTGPGERSGQSPLSPLQPCTLQLPVSVESSISVRCATFFSPLGFPGECTAAASRDKQYIRSQQDAAGSEKRYLARVYSFRLPSAVRGR